MGLTPGLQSNMGRTWRQAESFKALLEVAARLRPEKAGAVKEEAGTVADFLVFLDGGSPVSSSSLVDSWYFSTLFLGRLPAETYALVLD